MAYYSISINGISYISKEWAAQLALKLFMKPRAGRPKGAQTNYLTKSRWISISSHGHAIQAYRWPGGTKNILLLHGWESNTSRWKPYVQKLVDLGYTVYAIDAPAHGLSEGNEFTPELYADAIDAFLKMQEVDVIMGHSVGAYSAMIYCKRPERISRLKYVMLLAPTGKIKDFMNRSFDVLKIRQKVRDHYFRNFEAMYHHELSYYDAENLIKHTKLKGMLMHDKNDKTLPYSDSVLIAQNWPQGEFVSTEGYGHRLKSTEVSEIIFRYLKSIKDI